MMLSRTEYNQLQGIGRLEGANVTMGTARLPYNDRDQEQREVVLQAAPQDNGVKRTRMSHQHLLHAAPPLSPRTSVITGASTATTYSQPSEVGQWRLATIVNPSRMI